MADRRCGQSCKNSARERGIWHRNSSHRRGRAGRIADSRAVAPRGVRRRGHHRQRRGARAVRPAAAVEGSDPRRQGLRDVRCVRQSSTSRTTSHLMLGSPATSVDTAAKSVTFADGIHPRLRRVGHRDRTDSASHCRPSRSCPECTFCAPSTRALALRAELARQACADRRGRVHRLRSGRQPEVSRRRRRVARTPAEPLASVLGPTVGALVERLHRTRVSMSASASA